MTTGSGVCSNDFTVQRTWLVGDACGNSISYVQIITVTDDVAPVVSTPDQNSTIICDDGVDLDSVFNAWVMANGNAVASDNCTSNDDLD